MFKLLPTGSTHQLVLVSLPQLEQDRVVSLGRGRGFEVRRRLDGVSDEIGLARSRVVDRRAWRGHRVARGSSDVGSYRQ